LGGLKGRWEATIGGEKGKKRAGISHINVGEHFCDLKWSSAFPTSINHAKKS